MRSVYEKLEKGSNKEIQEKIIAKIKLKEKLVIITMNSEHFERYDLYDFYLEKNSMIVADGIAVHSLAKLKGVSNINKITGVSLTEFLLDYANNNSLSVGVLGANVESNSMFKEKINKEFSNIRNFKCVDGYQSNKEEIFKEFADAKLDIVIVGLGVPAQEIYIRDNIKYFDHGIFIGVGGSIDVIGGYKKRAPLFFQKSNTEWLYRIVKEPERFNRFIKSNFKLFYNTLFSKRLK